MREWGRTRTSADAETTPLRNPEAYQYDFDLPDIAEVWRRGSVIASWLLDLTAAALAASPELDHFAGRVSDSGEGRWTLEAAIDEGVPASVLSAALFSRFTSRGEADFQNQPSLRDARRVRRPCGEARLHVTSAETAHAAGSSTVLPSAAALADAAAERLALAAAARDRSGRPIHPRAFRRRRRRGAPSKCSRASPVVSRDTMVARARRVVRRALRAADRRGKQLPPGA